MDRRDPASMPVNNWWRMYGSHKGNKGLNGPPCGHASRDMVDIGYFCHRVEVFLVLVWHSSTHGSSLLVWRCSTHGWSNHGFGSKFDIRLKLYTIFLWQLDPGSKHRGLVEANFLNVSSAVRPGIESFWVGLICSEGSRVSRHKRKHTRDCKASIRPPELLKPIRNDSAFVLRSPERTWFASHKVLSQGSPSCANTWGCRQYCSRSSNGYSAASFHRQRSLGTRCSARSWIDSILTSEDFGGLGQRAAETRGNSRSPRVDAVVEFTRVEAIGRVVSVGCGVEIAVRLECEISRRRSRYPCCMGRCNRTTRRRRETPVTVRRKPTTIKIIVYTCISYQ